MHVMLKHCYLQNIIWCIAHIHETLQTRFQNMAVSQLVLESLALQPH